MQYQLEKMFLMPSAVSQFHPVPSCLGKVFEDANKFEWIWIDEMIRIFDEMLWKYFD